MDSLACSKIYGYAVVINTDKKFSRRNPFTPAATPAQQTDSLREGIYVTFTALSVTLVVASHPGTPLGATLVLLATTVGTVVAALTADALSHLAVHDRFLNGPELRHALRASLGSLVTVVAPFVLLGTSALGAWPVTPALWVSAAVLLATLVTVAAVAIRGINVPWWQRTLFLLTLGVAGLVVVWLQTLAHGSAATEMAMRDPVPFVLAQGNPEKDSVCNRLLTRSAGDPTDLGSCFIDGIYRHQKRHLT